jgi:ketosteroid isomerase-like protein
MSSETNIALVQKLYAAFGKGDVPGMLELFADDVDWGIEGKATPEVPWHGTGIGKPFALKFFQALSSEMTFSLFEPSGYVASDNAVACLVTSEATLKKNGQKLTQHDIHYFTIKNGRVTRWRGSEDTAYIKSVFAK